MTNLATQQKARGLIRIANFRLSGKYPFHAKIIERLVVRPHWECETMGVAADGHNVLLVFNPAFVVSLSIPELTGVLLHEVHHVLLGHLTTDPAAYPDRWARIVAQEVTVNEFVHEPLPDGGILLERFPDLPPMESTAQRYARLQQVTNRFPIRDPSGMLMADGSGQEPGVVLLDEHGLWPAESGQLDEVEESVKATLQDAAIAGGRGGVPDVWVRELRRRGISVDPGVKEDALGGTARSRLNWVRLLRRYAGQTIQRRADLMYPPRRMPEMVGVIPGRRHHVGCPRVTAVIDTSGSITPELLEQISAELGRLARRFRVTVIECDTKIRRVYPFKPITSVLGRGGTDLRPPFEPAILRKLRPDLMIYFTDGYGPAPASTPRVPVIWCLTPGGHAPATWGRVIPMEDTAGVTHLGPIHAWDRG